ncbi:MAG: phosphoadenylyl-sulfate reductase [Myxococcales bacterium]|nr:phosphoadenylyl-sulfate reductase [Myxococcales bacterium]
MSTSPTLEPPDPGLTDPTELLRWATDRFERIALATSLGPQSVVVLHLLTRIERTVDVFLLDTGLLFDETLHHLEVVQRRFDVEIERVQPTRTVAEQADDHGPQLWARNPDLCCALRKVAPLARHLSGYDAWIAGLRRDQSAARSSIRSVALDEQHGLVKLHPLAHWTRHDVLGWIRDHDLPLHPLLTEGYRSVGCRPCTVATTTDDERAGRWPLHRGKTECGIHGLTDGRQP